jgi:EAL domain-containing protein (putative c-di-GMP-specific phosphodiesterase class I)
MSKSMRSAMDSTQPYLERFADPQKATYRIDLTPLPFRIGRNPSSHLVVYTRQVSMAHAEIFRVDKQYFIRDLNTKNGTFVNGEPIEEAVLESGDILHLAHEEFRFISEPNRTAPTLETPATLPTRGLPPPSLIRGAHLIQELLAKKNARVLFQPIVHLDTGKPMGYEVLGRGTHGELSPKPTDLFALAQQCGLARELSRLFREVAVEDALKLAPQTRIFFNLHPEEVTDPLLQNSLRGLQEKLSARHQIVMEVHEDAVADIEVLRNLRSQLNALSFEFAYDDFGAGQSRLMEMAEIPPHFIKVDMRLIRDIHLASSRQNVLKAICQIAQVLGIQVIAEGIEKKEESAFCREIGCPLGQGYLFGRPQPSPLLEHREGGTHLMDVSQLRGILKSKKETSF